MISSNCLTRHGICSSRLARNDASARTSAVICILNRYKFGMSLYISICILTYGSFTARV